MSVKSLIYDDCCLLTNIDLNSQRIFQLLEHRFQSNSSTTSFDFKLFPPEQPSTNAKVSRSLLRFQPKSTSTIDDDDENVLSDGPSEEDEEDEEEEDNEEVFATNNDDYLDKLAEWQPGDFQPVIESDDEDVDESENIIQSVSTENNDENNQMDISIASDTPPTHVEDLLVTFIHRPPKSEPISYDDDVFLNPPQLDGHIDIDSTNSPTSSNRNDTEKNLDDVIAKVRAKTQPQNKVIELKKLPPTQNKLFLNDDKKRRSVNQPARKSFSSPAKPERIKEPIIKETQQFKKHKPYLLSSLKKNNEDFIRPFDSRLVSNLQKSSRTSSDSVLQPTIHKKIEQRNMSTSLSNDERTNSQQHMKSSLMKKQTNQSKIKEKSASDHMSLAQRKLNNFQKHQQSTMESISKPSTSKSKENIKIPLKPSKSVDSSVQKPKSTLKTSVLNDHNQQIKKKPKKLKRLDIEQSNSLPSSPLQTKDNATLKPKKQISINNYVTKKPKLNSHRSEPSIETTVSNNKTNKRPADYFTGCIIIDDDEEGKEEQNNNEDDDILEIEHQNHSISYNIRSREKLLDHAVHSSAMHINWLINLEYLLLEHIFICHENSIRPLNKVYENSNPIKCESPTNCLSYQINPSFISIIIINFLKMFILKNSTNDQQEVSFNQFGITSHLRYLLIELPTYNHNEEKDCHDDCSKCHQYSLIINILFDLLFDLIEYDICEKKSITKYRSSLIQDDYFMRFSQSKNSFFRIKVIIYFIELIGIHTNKCQKKKQFQFNQNETKLFHSIEGFIRHIISHTNNLINERLGICFNVMELCLLFVNEKEMRIKQMGLFLAELCENNSVYLNLFLFQKNLLADIRLLLINELISKKFHLKFNSIESINEVFRQIQGNFNSSNPIDDSLLLLVRSLFSTYADLIIEIKTVPLMYSSFTQQLTLILRNELDLIYGKLRTVSFNNEVNFKQNKRTLFLYCLLKCKWNKL